MKNVDLLYHMCIYHMMLNECTVPCMSWRYQKPGSGWTRLEWHHCFRSVTGRTGRGHCRLQLLTGSGYCREPGKTDSTHGTTWMCPQFTTTIFDIYFENLSTIKHCMSDQLQLFSWRSEQVQHLLLQVELWSIFSFSFIQRKYYIMIMNYDCYLYLIDLVLFKFVLHDLLGQGMA